jgi:hypothetical protein
MWALLAAPDRGTHYFSAATNSMNLLDQFVSGAQSAIGLSLPFGFGNYAAFC